MAQTDEEYGAALRSDFKSLQAIATCSICDQLLYEPWTIACGHTYCYSCLCSWFAQDKRKKSCPDCRLKVKAMPAPSFLIKQLVEVILKRSELLHADESTEQHQKKRLEEIELVDKDRNSSKGLFKGMFSVKINSLWRDDSDGVLRCSGCGFEHEGGPLCSNCGEAVDEDDYGHEADDSATVELGSWGFGLDAESEDELFDFHNSNHFNHNVSSYIDMTYTRRVAAILTPNRFYSNQDDTEAETIAESDSEITELSVASDSSGSETDEEEDDSSLQDFIAPEDDDIEDFEHDTNEETEDQYSFQVSSSHRRTMTISDYDSDEGGAISNRRQRHRRNNIYSTNLDSPSPVPSVITITDTNSNGSETGEHGNEIELLRHTGWSPLDHGSESDLDSSHLPSRVGSGYAPDSDNESDTNTETMVDREMLDNTDEIDEDNGDNDNVSQEMYGGSSETMTYPTSSLQSNALFYRSLGSSNSQSTDGDGDTDMGTSTSFLGNSHSGERYTSNSWESYPMIGRNNCRSNQGEIEDGTIRLRSWQTPQRHSGNNETCRKSSYDSDGTRRKRSAWESSTQDASEIESVKTNFRSRRRITLDISKMCHNQRAIGPELLASRSLDENNMTCNDSNNTRSNSEEIIGFANVVNDLDEESDDSIQHPPRRHLKHSNSNIWARKNEHARFVPGICSVLDEQQQCLRNRYGDDLLINQLEAQQIELGSRTRQITAYQKLPMYELDISRNILSQSTICTTAPSWATRNSINH